MRTMVVQKESRNLELEEEWEVLACDVVNVKQTVNMSFLLSDMGQRHLSQEVACGLEGLAMGEVMWQCWV